MTDFLTGTTQTAEDIEWDYLLRQLDDHRCILFLGPGLPVYNFQEKKYDFYSLAAGHLSRLLIENGVDFDHNEAQNLYYVAQKFLAFRKNNRIRLEDEIADLYNAQVEQIKAESNEAMPALYKSILQLPWHTIVNMQPDTFFKAALKPNEVFSYYDYKPDEVSELKVEKDQFLVYNLFGAAVKDNAYYRVESLVLTEEDQVEFVRNIVSGNPKVPGSVISRFDDRKIYIFLDCNLENWYFRLLMEMLKIHKESHTYFPRLKSRNFPPSIVEFYKFRYGFVFINNNSEEFINRLCEEYNRRHQQECLPPTPKKLFIAYDDSDEELVHSLARQFEPWVRSNQINIWTKEAILPGQVALREEEAQFFAADSILLVISARFLSEASYNRYVKPALEAAKAAGSPKKVFAVIKSACPWQETEIHNLPPQCILPANHIPIRLQQQEDPDKILYEIASSVKKVLCE